MNTIENKEYDNILLPNEFNKDNYKNEHFYFKPIDTNNIEEMLKYLDDHETYRESFHSHFCYSNNIKVDHLNLFKELTKEEIDICYEILFEVNNIYWNIYTETYENWQYEFDQLYGKQFQIYIYGRQGGHLCLYENNKPFSLNSKHTNMNFKDNFEYLGELESLQFYVQVLQSFDILTDLLRSDFISIVKQINNKNQAIESFIGKYIKEVDKNTFPLDYYDNEYLIPITENNFIIGFYDNEIDKVYPKTLEKIQMVNYESKYLVHDSINHTVKKTSFLDLMFTKD